MRDATQPGPASDPPRRVVLLAVVPAQLLDVAGPAEVLAQAGRLRATLPGGTGKAAPLYAVTLHIVSGEALPATTAGIGLTSDATAAELLADARGIDTLIVAGGEGARTRADEAAVRQLVERLAARSRRVVGICTGSFVLAAAGLLHGRRAVTHWRWCAELARRFPTVRVEPEPIFIRDGDIWTSAGVTAGMDLTLALVEADHGHALALAIARELVLFLRRTGDQKQFSAAIVAQATPSARFRDLVAWLSENLGRSILVSDMAERACLSPRQFARSFAAETTETPARLLERLRVEAARRRIEAGRDSLRAVAATCGFGTEETMRRAFLRQLGVPPGDYRAHFARPRRTTNQQEQPPP